MSPMKRAVSVQVLPEADTETELEVQEVYWVGVGGDLRKIKKGGSLSRQRKPETTLQI